MLTYWLTGEDPEVRRARLRTTNHPHLLGIDLPGSTPPAAPAPAPAPYSPYPCPASPCLRPFCVVSNSSPLHSGSPSPSHSPRLGGTAGSVGSSSSKVKLPDPASGSPVVYDLLKDSDSGRGGPSGDYINGVSPFRGRLHSFKDAMQRRARMTATNSEPLIHDPSGGAGPRNNHLSVPEVVASAPGEVTSALAPEAVETSALTPVLKGRRRDNLHCFSVYDNASPSELSVLLGERAHVSGLDEAREDLESSLSIDSAASLHRL